MNVAGWGHRITSFRGDSTISIIAIQQEVIHMAEKEKQIAQALADAVAILPEEKKEYFLGFAEGVAAMAEQVKAKPNE